MVANDQVLLDALRAGLRPQDFPGRGIQRIVVQDVDYNGEL